MSSTPATCSLPSSLQLRLALSCKNCGKFPSVLVRARVRKLDHRVSVLCHSVVRNEAKNRRVNERRSGVCWAGTDSAADGFSGWSESDAGDEVTDPSRKKWFGGLLGIGITGIILVSGITFAAWSISKQKSSRHRQQMEALSAQEELLLASDDGNDTLDEDVKEDKCMDEGDRNVDDETGKIEEFSSGSENKENLNTSKVGDGTDLKKLSGDDVESLSGNNDVTNVASMPEEIAYNSTLVEKPVSPESSHPLKLHESDTLVHSDSKVLNNHPAVGTEVITSEPETNDWKVDLENLPNFNTNALNLKNDLMDETPDSSEYYNFNSNSIPEKFPHSDDSLSDYNSGNQDEIPSPISSENSVSLLHDSLSNSGNTTKESSLDYSGDLQSTSISRPHTLFKDDRGTVIALSSKEQLLTEAITSPFDQQIERGLSGGAFVSVPTFALANEQEKNHHTVMNGNNAEPELQGIFFSSAGVPAPLVSSAIKAVPGKVLVPAVVDQVQGQALAALQVLKVIEIDVQPSDLCTRREYARWLVSASAALSRNTISKVYPAMYIENITELAFDDITPEDPDFASIQGLAEAGLISSKLSRRDISSSLDDDQGPIYFSPESPLSRQDLVSWKMATEKRQLPEADRKVLRQASGFIDTDKIHPDACPAIVTDLSLGEQGIIALAFGYTRLFQPDKPVTKAQAAMALATGEASDIVSEELARIEAETMAENAVAAHNDLVAQVEKDINESFEKELSIEREKVSAVEKMAEEARQELERLRSERERDNIALVRERAAIESEMEVLSRLRNELEEQLQSLMGNKAEISYEKERVSKLRKEAEMENQEITRLQYELEVERKALSMARAWAEDEAKRAREQAKTLEEARDRWEKSGIKVVVESDLREQESAGVTWLDSSKQFTVEETVDRAENLMDKLKVMGAELRGKSKDVIDMIIEKITILVSKLKQWASTAGREVEEFKDVAISRASRSVTELQESSAELSLALKEGAKRVVGDCREGVEKITQKFKM